MQDRICQVDETSCNARPDHTFRVNRVLLTVRRPLPVYPDKQTISKPVGPSRSCQQQRPCYGQFRTHSPVIAAMVELDKRYAENVGDVPLFKRAARWL